MSALITADFNGTQVFFQNDAYLNATTIAKSFNKQPRDYLKTEQTKAYLTALAQNISTKTNILVKQNQLVRVKNGGNDRGTWLHPKLAIHFARWLSAEFAVWCDEQIEKILHKIIAPKTTTDNDRLPLRNAVNTLSAQTGIHWKTLWTMVNQYMGTQHVNELTTEQLPKAIAYVHELTIKAGQKSETNLSTIQTLAVRDLIESVWELNSKVSNEYLEVLKTANFNKAELYQQVICDANQACINANNKLGLNAFLDNLTLKTRFGGTVKMPWRIV